MNQHAYKICVLFLFFYGTKLQVINDRYYPRYHLAPPQGWMNDPNGFCFFQGEYHLFYQYNPNSSQVPGIAHWGHAKSSDMFHWKDLGVAMYPDQPYDKDGVFSGSAIVEKNSMVIFYTGHINHPGEDPSHEEHQHLAISKDGLHVEKYENNPVIEGKEFQPDIRDPKVWKHGNTYYMVLGNSFNGGTLGRVLLYSSADMIRWKQESVLLQSDGSLGYMFECPDFFKLNDLYVLLFSPQGVKSQGDKYNNIFQTGYVVGKFDYTNHKFEPLTEFRELDHGHDFYATQTIEDKNKNRVMVAWFDMWETKYPEKDDGFTGQMTLPRVLSLTDDNRIIQKPIKQIAYIRGPIIYSGMANRRTAVSLPDNTGEIGIIAPRKDFQLRIESNNSNVFISYDSVNKTVTLDRGGEDGIRRTKWQPNGNKLNWRVFIDTSSIEIFCGEGEVTFSSRFFPSGRVKIRLGQNSRADIMIVRTLKHTVDIPTNAI